MTELPGQRSNLSKRNSQYGKVPFLTDFIYFKEIKSVILVNLVLTKYQLTMLKNQKKALLITMQ